MTNMEFMLKLTVRLSVENGHRAQRHYFLLETLVRTDIYSHFMTRLLFMIRLHNYIVSLDKWNRTEFPYTKEEYGKWSLTIPPNSDGTPRIRHLSEIKVLNKLP